MESCLLQQSIESLTIDGFGTSQRHSASNEQGCENEIHGLVTAAPKCTLKCDLDGDLIHASQQGLDARVLVGCDKLEMRADGASTLCPTLSETNESLASTITAIRVSLPGDGDSCRSFARMTQEMAHAASQNNLLHQWMAPGNSFFRSEVQISLQEGVPKGRRNSLDLAGKIPLALKMLSLGLSQQDLSIDFSQAGGMYE